MTRPTIIAGNWKQNPSRGEGESLYRGVCEGLMARAVPPSLSVILLPPFPFLASLPPHPRVELGAQDVAVEPWGAYTGEVGAPTLREFGASHALVGHSERRTHLAESDAQIARKAKAALAAGLVPILCIGETEEERKSGVTDEVLDRQVVRVLEELPENGPLVIAYEPVWAIGAGVNATPAMAAAAHAFIRERLATLWSKERAQATPILYGGSVTAENAPELMREPEIGGVLVGGASLRPESFLAIVDAALAAAGGGKKQANSRSRAGGRS
ncbi:MAG: triose-phosphate isomerase [Planctomycetes bacterium]|nr:triose-phosphate isomerase [Planctomycetota bacterium]